MKKYILTAVALIGSSWRHLKLCTLNNDFPDIM